MGKKYLLSWEFFHKILKKKISARTLLKVKEIGLFPNEYNRCSKNTKIDKQIRYQ